MNNLQNRIKKIVEIINNANEADSPEIYFGEEFQLLFDDGDTIKIICELVETYRSDSVFKSSVDNLKYWISIDDWIQTYVFENTIQK